jgi:lambda repressor-like predicted transcriptional regulator
MDKKMSDTLRACGATLAVLTGAKPYATAEWISEFVRSPKTRLAQYANELNAAGLAKSTDEKIAQAVGNIDIDVFAALPGTLTAEMQGLVWLGYYAEKGKKEWSPEKLRTAFEKSGLTQNELAIKTGISQPHISAHMSGGRKPRPEVLRKYEEALGLKPGEIS